MAKFVSDGKTDTAFFNFGSAKRLWSILLHEAKALLELFCLQPIAFG